MQNKPLQIQLGSNLYLLPCQDGFILLDAGIKGKVDSFKQALQKNNITPHQIKLIIITHVHYDHTGSLQQIKTLCGCPVAVHKNEEKVLRTGEITVPPGTTLFGKLFYLFGKLTNKKFDSTLANTPDIIINGEFSLKEYGFDGKVIHTPGHTAGSITVVCANGDAFVGDLAFNMLANNKGPIFPPFAEDVPELLRSWKRLMDMGVKTIFPGHGASFPIERLSNKYNELRGRYLKTP